MAHLVTGYAGHAHISSADDGAFNASFFGGGQYAMEFGNCFEGSIIDNNTVRILDGDGLMYGRHFRIEPNSYEDMTITTGTAGTNRIDLICMTYEKNAEDETERCYLQVIKGTETTGTAVAPEYTDGNILEGASFNQMPLYKVTIEGVVLKSIEPLFERLPSYEKLAEIYAERFEAACEEIKKSYGVDNVLKKADVVDSFDSTDPTAPFSANKGRELFQSVSNGKALIASAITDKKVPTDATATFAQMASNIESLKLGSGNATKANVLSGKTFTNSDGVEYTGEMTNNAGTTKSATCSVDSTNKRVQLTIPANAYYSTASKLYDTYANVASKIGLTAAKLVSGNTVLGIAGTAKAFPSSCTVLLSTTTQYSSSKAFSNCPVGVIMMIDVYGYSGTVTVSGMTVIKQTNSNIAQYSTSFIVGVTTSSTVTVKATSFYLEYVAYLS